MKITDILTEAKQKDSNILLKEVEKIENVKKQLLNKKANADQEINELQLQLARLDKEYLFETDPAMIKELAEKKKDIRYKIEEYESTKNTKYRQVIKDMLKDIEHYYDKASKENDKLHSDISILEKQYNEEWEAYNKSMQEKLDDLNKLKYKHAFTQAANKYMAMKMDKFDW